MTDTGEHDWPRAPDASYDQWAEQQAIAAREEPPIRHAVTCMMVSGGTYCSCGFQPSNPNTHVQPVRASDAHE